jgi:hypothetical protein
LTKQGASAAVEPLRLEKDDLLLAFDGSTGAITEIRDASVDLSLTIDPTRAGSWKLLIPLPGRRGHYVGGSSQPLRDASVFDDRLTLAWTDLESSAGRWNIELELEVRIEDGQIIFQLNVENGSGYVIEEAIAPYISGIASPDAPDEWRLVGPRIISGAFEYPIFDQVPSSYHGAGISNVLHPYPGGWTNEMSLGMPWVALERKTGEALYIGNHDSMITYSAFLAEFDTQLRLDSGTQAAFGNSAPQRWPDEPSESSNLALAWASFPFCGPGESFEGPPIALRFLPEGGWRAATEQFRTGFQERTRAIPRPRTWLSDSDAWLSMTMRFNDGTVARRIGDLPQIARDCANAGIETLLLSGWSTGGLDSGFPFYRVDPVLGSEDEFRNAMDRCRQEGVGVLLMTQLQQICPETDWFRREGHRYLVRNPNGDPYYYGGVHYGSNTLLNQLGFSAPQIITANLAHSGFRKLVLDELDHVMDLGADGMLIDKLHTGDPYSLDYNPELPGTPATRFHRALYDTLVEFVEAARRRNPQFAIAAECGWDRAMVHSEASYSRYFERDHLPVQELALPHVRWTTTMVGDTDTHMVNNALRYGHVICAEPQYCHGDIASIPNLARYIGEVHKLRMGKLRHLLWDGNLIDPVVAGLRVEGPVGVGAFTGGRALADPDSELAIVLNHFEDADQVASIAAEPRWRSATLYQPFQRPETVAPSLEGIVVPFGEYVVIVLRQA